MAGGLGDSNILFEIRVVYFSGESPVFEVAREKWVVGGLRI